VEQRFSAALKIAVDGGFSRGGIYSAFFRSLFSHKEGAEAFKLFEVRNAGPRPCSAQIRVASRVSENRKGHRSPVHA
jgi:hypothetical protein